MQDVPYVNCTPFVDELIASFYLASNTATTTTTAAAAAAAACCYITITAIMR